jgi:hypothetical protein
MFYLLLPAGICLGALIPSLIINSYHQDDRNFGGACINLISTPLALVCGIIAIVDCFRRQGGRKAFMHGLLWNALIVAVMSLVFLALARGPAGPAPH